MEKPPFAFAFENFPLGPTTLYNVGGPAKVALFPNNEAEAHVAHTWMFAQSGPHLILGGGSNVLIADEGFPGIVLFTNNLTSLKPLGNHRYFVGSGIELDELVRDLMLAQNYDGVGGFTGIPGSVGGAIYMNAGTANGTICELMVSVDLITTDGPRTVMVDDSCFSYRGQHFCVPGAIILGGVFQFRVADCDQRAIYNHYIRRRRETQPQGCCCGSVFKNPEGDHAGRLIEACGLKGKRHGGACISPKHANFIMNENGASFGDIVTLIELAKRSVSRRFDVVLEEEVQVIR